MDGEGVATSMNVCVAVIRSASRSGGYRLDIGLLAVRDKQAIAGTSLDDAVPPAGRFEGVIGAIGGGLNQHAPDESSGRADEFARRPDDSCGGRSDLTGRPGV